MRRGWKQKMGITVTRGIKNVLEKACDITCNEYLPTRLDTHVCLFHLLLRDFSKIIVTIVNRTESANGVVIRDPCAVVYKRWPAQIFSHRFSNPPGKLWRFSWIIFVLQASVKAKHISYASR